MAMGDLFGYHWLLFILCSGCVVVGCGSESAVQIHRSLIHWFSFTPATNVFSLSPTVAFL
jgi:hypothetical protein